MGDRERYDVTIDCACGRRLRTATGILIHSEDTGALLICNRCDAHFMVTVIRGGNQPEQPRRRWSDNLHDDTETLGDRPPPKRLPPDLDAPTDEVPF